MKDFKMHIEVFKNDLYITHDQKVFRLPAKDTETMLNSLKNYLEEHINIYDIHELPIRALFQALENMGQQLFHDVNEITSYEDITLSRILDEIASCDLKFNDKGDIICD
jgi:hypothetical protein